MMKMKAAAISLSVLCALVLCLPLAQAQQSALSLFPDDVVIVAEIDVPTLAKLFNERNRLILSRRVGNATGIDPVKYFRTLYIGVSGGDTAGGMLTYVIMKGSATAGQLAAIARGAGKVIHETAIGGQKAWTDGGLSVSTAKTMYLVDGGPGSVIAGTRPAIERLQALLAGKGRNASGNTRLRDLAASVRPGSGIRIYGYGGNGVISSSHVDAFALGIGFTGSALDMDMRLVTDNPSTWDWLNANLALAAQYAPQADPGGKVAEMLRSVVSERVPHGVRITASVPVATIEYLNTNMDRIIGNAMMAALKANMEKRQKK
jgi:hypothetical protein